MFLTVFLCQTELFEIELFNCIKMDLALNYIQSLICHKTQTNKLDQTNLITLKIEIKEIIYKRDKKNLHSNLI